MMQDYNLENSNDQEYCESLTFVRMRHLTDPEISNLNSKSRRTVLILVFIIFSLPCIFIGLFFIAETISQFRVFQEYINTSLLFIVSMVYLVGLSFVVVISRDNIKKYRLFRNIIRKRQVRRFKGQADNPDYRKYLYDKFNGKLQSNPPDLQSVQIEAFPAHDILYSFNGVVAKKWYEINITKAAVVDKDPAYYNIPEEWKGSNVSEDEVDTPDTKRRRLNQSEVDELWFYYKRSWRKFLYLPFISYVTAGILHLVLFRLIGLDEKHKLLVLGSGAIASFIIFGYKMYSNSAMIKEDAECGWVIHSVFYDEDEEKSEESKGYSHEIEHLIHTESIWRIDGDPADWRHKNKKEPK